MLKILKLQFNTKRRKYQYLGYTVGDNVGLWLGKGYSISSVILRSWVRKSDDTGDKNKWQLLTSNSHLIVWYIKIDFISWLQKYSFRKMYSMCMETSQWANESAEQTPATHSFRHFKMYWHREYHVPTIWVLWSHRQFQTKAKSKSQRVPQILW